MTDPYKELREGLERLKAAVGVLRGPEADVAALLAERDTLKEALEAVVVGYQCGHDLSIVIGQVRAALSQSEPQGQR